jgi:hypothetical protein
VEDDVHYTAGFGALASFGAAEHLPDDSLLWRAARVMLDTAGAVFALYLLIALLLLLIGRVLRSRRRRADRAAAPLRGRPAHLRVGPARAQERSPAWPAHRAGRPPSVLRRPPLGQHRAGV